MAGFDLDTAPDLAAIEDEGVVIALKDELGAPMMDGDAPVTWTQCGTYSTTYRKAQRALREIWQRRARVGDDSVHESDEVYLAVACAKGFTGFYSKGQPVPFSRDAARAILSSPKAQHILAQVQQAMGNHERFFATGSAP